MSLFGKGFSRSNKHGRTNHYNGNGHYSGHSQTSSRGVTSHYSKSGHHTGTTGNSVGPVKSGGGSSNSFIFGGKGKLGF